jgi:hypothetical protein
MPSQNALSSRTMGKINGSRKDMNEKPSRSGVSDRIGFGSRQYDFVRKESPQRNYAKTRASCGLS